MHGFGFLVFGFLGPGWLKLREPLGRSGTWVGALLFLALSTIWNQMTPAVDPKQRKILQEDAKYMDLGSIPIGFDRLSIRMGWKWVRIDGKGYTNTTSCGMFRPCLRSVREMTVRKNCLKWLFDVTSSCNTCSHRRHNKRPAALSVEAFLLFHLWSREKCLQKKSQRMENA